MDTERKRVQPPRIVESRLSSLPNDAPPEERQMLLWMLRRSSYPKWRYKVTKAVEAEVNVTGDIDVHARGVKTTEKSQTGIIDLNAILSIENPENSYDHLRILAPPITYRPIPTLSQFKESFEKNLYFLTDNDIFTVHQAIMLGRALLVSGPPGTGKSSLGEQIALAMGLNVSDQHQFSKLFCTPDIGISEAIYQWNDPKRLLDLQLINGVVGAFGGHVDVMEMYRQVATNAYGLRYLEIRKLLRACVIPYRTVTLIDEADKPYPTFDNELLDIIDAYRYDIPEYGALGKPLGHPHDDANNPFFILTVNDTASGGRDLSPMLVSRCTPLFLNYLPASLEQKVIHTKCGLETTPSSRIAQFFYTIRTNLNMRNPPSTREVIATAQALVKTGLEATEQNLFRLNCHWCKNRLDNTMLTAKYMTRDYQGKEVWRESL